MAQFVLGDQDLVRDSSPRDDNDHGDLETSQGGMEGDKRHYKKDSRLGSDSLCFILHSL